MKEIKAREGYYLTQVAEVGDNRLFVVVIKGVNINEADWREATEEEMVAENARAKTNKLTYKTE